jgi:uncharacterized protein (DUF302 family)
MRRVILPALLLALIPAAQAADPHPIVTYTKTAKFADVRDDVKIAIENRALVIDSTSHIGKMLERTGKDLGATRKVYVDGEAFSFCSAVLSRKTMEADPHNIAFCPYAISVYTTTQEPDKVYVSYQRPWRPDGTPSSKASLREVEELLDGIVREALGIKK